MPTIRDVARAAGVSVATVSAVINQNKYVSDELKERVARAIKELDYRPSRLGRALSLRKTSTVGVLVPTIINPFFPSIVKAVEDVAFARGYGLLICNTEDEPTRVEKYRDSLQSAYVDGVLMTLSSELARPEVYRSLLDSGVPVVGLAGSRVLPDIDCVMTNDVEGARHLAAYLIALGHRRIWYIGVKESRSSSMRQLGIGQAMAAVGLEFDERHVRLAQGYTEADGYRATMEALSTASPPPTALICYNDVIAVGAMRASLDLGRAVPEDLSVAGYDNTLGEYTFPRLTTMAVPTTEMGELAANLLLDRIEGKRTEPPRVYHFLPRLVERSSTCSPKR